ncbi:MAG: hypothetical protein JEZ14_14160 [Marinilabiliaceae bacterium]|nr:hypothetical protein [Marinilabiliaceae bacterium]
MQTYDQAEKAYWHAWQMVPHKFYPKYLLAKLYDESGQQDKAIITAEELINKEIKVKSIAIDEMKNEIRNIISKK